MLSSPGWVRITRSRFHRSGDRFSSRMRTRTLSQSSSLPDIFHLLLVCSSPAYSLLHRFEKCRKWPGVKDSRSSGSSVTATGCEFNTASICVHTAPNSSNDSDTLPTIRFKCASNVDLIPVSHNQSKCGECREITST